MQTPRPSIFCYWSARACCLLLLAVMPLQAQLPEKLQGFLETRPFRELIQSHAQEHVVLVAEGKKADRQAALPYREETGFRCQVFASSERERADEMAAQIEKLKLAPVYVSSSSSGLYKVQVGNFRERRDAELMLDRLRNSGVKGAWIVDTTVNIAKNESEVAAVREKQRAREMPTGESYYTIQVFATGDVNKANQVKSNLEEEVSQPVSVQPQGKIWKVFVGKFSTRLSAEDFLNILRSRQYLDAWITQVGT